MRAQLIFQHPEIPLRPCLVSCFPQEQLIAVQSRLCRCRPHYHEQKRFSLVDPCGFPPALALGANLLNEQAPQRRQNSECTRGTSTSDRHTSRCSAAQECPCPPRVAVPDVTI